MKTLKFLLYAIAYILIINGVISQTRTETNFYYYKGTKYYIEADYNTISVSLKNKNAITSLDNNTNSLSDIVEDYTRSNTVIIDQNAQINERLKTFYVEVSKKNSLTRQAYYDQINSYNNIPDVVIASPSYRTKEGQLIGLSNNFYVKLKNQQDVELLYQKAKETNTEILGHNRFMPLWFSIAVTKSSDGNAIEMANIFYETRLFEAAEPAFIYHNLEVSNDPFFNNQWSLKNTNQNIGTPGIDIDTEEAWTITSGTSSIKTAVFDHGIELDHPDLQNNITDSYDATTGTSPSIVRGSHGTACGGIVGAIRDNNIGISGVAPKSKLMSISINLQFSDTPQQLADGFNWAWKNGADVISNSWGGYAPSSIIDNAISNTLSNGRDGKGTVVVFAAGNENNTNIRYPGNSNPGILVVGAMSPCGERKNPNSCDGETWGSCYGSQLDVIAPGVKMPTTDRQGLLGYDNSDYTQTFNGTSSACPVVAGVASLVLSVNPDLTVQEVNKIIESSAQKVRTDLYSYTNTNGRPNGTWNLEMGYGMVNAHQAVLAAQITECIENLIITQNVTSGQTDIQEASNGIVVKNTIFNNGTASYNAGFEITLTPNFDANLGANIDLFIEDCSNTQRNLSKSIENNKISYRFIKNNIDNKSINNEENNLSIYPNPSSGKITIEYQFTNNELYQIELYNYLGKKILEKKINKSNNVINLENLQNGIYFIKLFNKQSVETKEIVISK